MSFSIYIESIIMACIWYLCFIIRYEVSLWTDVTCNSVCSIYMILVDFVTRKQYFNYIIRIEWLIRFPFICSFDFDKITPKFESSKYSAYNKSNTFETFLWNRIHLCYLSRYIRPHQHIRQHSDKDYNSSILSNDFYLLFSFEKKNYVKNHHF